MRMPESAYSSTRTLDVVTSAAGVRMPWVCPFVSRWADLPQDDDSALPANLSSPLLLGTTVTDFVYPAVDSVSARHLRVPHSAVHLCHSDSSRRGSWSCHGAVPGDPPS